MYKETSSEKNNKFRQLLKKNIPLNYKRQSSLEKKNLRITKRLESIKPEENINHRTVLSINDNTKSSLNIFMFQNNINKSEKIKKLSPKNKKSNSKLNFKIIELRNDKVIKDKENNYTNINIILENKEKTKMLNRKGSNPKLKISNNSIETKNHIICNNKKKNNLLRVKSGAFKLNKKKLLNENKVGNDDKNIKNKLIIISQQEKTPNNTKRNTDSIIQLKHKDNNFEKEKIANSNRNNEKINNLQLKKNKNKGSNSNFSNKHNSNKNKIIKKRRENILNINSSNNKKIISPISIINNNISNDICNINKNNFENSLHKRKKNIDINLEHQVSPKIKNINDNFNNTTSKIKLKTNGLITNIEMDKDKEFLHLTENNSIIQSKTRAKIKYNNRIRQSDSELTDKNIIFNNNRIEDKNLPLFIRKCGSANENKYLSFDKNRLNKMLMQNLTEENNKEKNNNDEEDTNPFDETINLNDIYNKKEINIHNLYKKINNEQINKKNNQNKNIENSFATINFYNSNIDENDYNEPINNFVHAVKNYNFISNKNNNNEENLKIINNNSNKENNNIINEIKNEIFENNLYKIKKMERTVIPTIPIKDYKNVYNNFLCNNNNYSNCNTGNTSNNQNNIIKSKENIEFNKNNIFSENINNKEEKIEHQNEIIIKKDNDNKENPNGKSKRDLLKQKILDKRQIEEKDLSLDKSTSLRLFPVVQEDFIEKEDEVIKLLNFQSPRESNNDKNINIYSNNEDESEIIFQNSEYSKEISLLINNDYNKYNNLMNNKNIYQNSPNIQNQNINIENIGLKDTSIISNIGIKGCKSITQGGKEKTGHRKKNQDFYIIEKNINNILGFNLFAILDGHGVNGHFVSQFTSKLIIKKIIEIANKNNDKFTDTESIYNFFKKSDFQIIINIFLEIDKKIMDQKGFDITLSGTTCCLVIQLYEHIICSNIGDSRGILIFDENKIFELSHDSKPNIPEETKRINLMGGIVDQVKNENGEKTGPFRVYIKNMDLPGLAMSRSFGDKKAKSCGVIPYPDIIEYTLNNDSKYMLICSDGVWEFLSNEEVMEIGNKYYAQNNINELCSQLLKKSTEIWENEENYIDDITIVAVFF